jgi:hypothetical protein
MTISKTIQSILFPQTEQNHNTYDTDKNEIFGSNGFLNFEIRLHRLRDGYHVEVSASPDGQAVENFIPPSEQMIERFVRKVSQSTNKQTTRLSSLEYQGAKDFGRQLFQSLFAGEVMVRFDASLRMADSKNCGVRLKLHLDNVPELQSMPWEYLYCPHRHMFIAPQRELPIIRSIGAGGRTNLPVVKPPIKILAMIAGPAIDALLPVYDEREKLESVLQPLIQEQVVQLEWVNGGSAAALERHMSSNSTNYHIFHIIGCGKFDEEIREGIVVFDSMTNCLDHVTGDKLGVLLNIGKRKYTLVILNTQRWDQVELADPSYSLSCALIRQDRTPAVLAMRFPAIGVTEQVIYSYLYNEFAAGKSIEQTVGTVRQKLFARFPTTDWGKLVLYSGS